MSVTDHSGVIDLDHLASLLDDVLWLTTSQVARRLRGIRPEDVTEGLRRLAKAGKIAVRYKSTYGVIQCVGIHGNLNTQRPLRIETYRRAE